MITKLKELIKVYSLELETAETQLKYFRRFGSDTPDKIYWKNRVVYLENFISDLKSLLKTPDEKVKDQLITAQDKYISILGEEISGLVGIASIHGWKSSLSDSGTETRTRIATLKEKLRG